MAILNDMLMKRDIISNSAKKFTKNFRTEIALFEAEGTRDIYLQNTYTFLKTIQTTSVESERGFSASGNIITKLRSYLEDETLDALCFLKAFFKKEKNKE